MNVLWGICENNSNYFFFKTVLDVIITIMNSIFLILFLLKLLF